jgi:uncharacterized protein YjbI with pentapeptide repeats
MLLELQYKLIRWHTDLRVDVRRIVQKLSDPFQKLPFCFWIVLTALLVWRMVKFIGEAVGKIPNWITLFLVVALLSYIALWINGIEVPFSKELMPRGEFKKVVQVIFENAESISITSLVMLYFQEAPDRKAQRHYEVTQVLDIASSGGSPTSYARFIALQDLNKDGFPLRGLDVPGANLEGIQLPSANLSGAKLQEANLLRANLRGANLKEAKLSEAKLTRADLKRADLRQTNLRGANLESANLQAANLYKADLEKADLWGANLEGANLEGANLLDANLEKANLRGATLKEAQLKNARLCQTTLPDGTISDRDCPGLH